MTAKLTGYERIHMGAIIAPIMRAGNLRGRFKLYKRETGEVTREVDAGELAEGLIAHAGIELDVVDGWCSSCKSALANGACIGCDALAARKALEERVRRVAAAKGLDGAWANTVINLRYGAGR